MTEELDFDSFMSTLRSKAAFVADADDAELDYSAESGVTTRLGAISRAFVPVMNEDPDAPIVREILEYLETALATGDENVQAAVATGFFDGLIHADSRGETKVETIAKWLGPETIAYCRYYDNITGDKTRGIWPRAVD